MRANFDVQYWLHVGQTNSDSQPMTSRAKNRSWWYSEPVSFSNFNHDIETIPQPAGQTEQVTGSHQLSISTLMCNDRDYETAIIIAATLEKHAIAVCQNMPNNGLKGIILTFFEKLPQQFDRQGYLKVAEELGIQPKAAEKYIAQFRPSLLHHEHNLYTKISK